MKHIILAAIVIVSLAAPARAYAGWSIAVAPGGFLAPPPPPPPPVYAYPPYARGYSPAPVYPGGYYAVVPAYPNGYYALAPSPYHHRRHHRDWY